LETFEELARYLPEAVRRIALWMALTSRGLQLSFASKPGYQRIEVPHTPKVLLEVRTGDACCAALLSVSQSRRPTECLCVRRCRE
jgi:hypothetical protein